MLKNPPLVSVILPTHNRANLLARSISSVLSQSYKNFELIIINDGSRDNTKNIINSFNDKRIIYLEHKNSRGGAAARNSGIKESSGEYIAFHDDDDEWTEYKLEKQIPILINSPKDVGLVYGWMEYFKDRKSIKIYTPSLKGYILKEMLSENSIGGCPSIIIKKKVLNKSGLFNENIYRHDADFIRKICKHYKVDFLPEIVVNVNTCHKNRLSNMGREKSINTIEELKNRIIIYRDDFKKYPDELEKVYLKISAHFFYLLNIKYCVRYIIKAYKVLPQKTISKKIFFYLNFLKKIININ